MGGPAVGGAPACLASNGEGNGAVAWTSDGQEGRAYQWPAERRTNGGDARNCRRNLRRRKKREKEKPKRNGNGMDDVEKWMDLSN